MPPMRAIEVKRTAAASVSSEGCSARHRGGVVLGHPSSSPRTRSSSFRGEIAGPPPSRGRRHMRATVVNRSAVASPSCESDSASHRGVVVLRHPSSSPRRRGSSFHGELAGPPPSRERRHMQATVVDRTAAASVSSEGCSALHRGGVVLGHPSSSPRRRGSSFHGERAGPPPSRGRRHMRATFVDRSAAASVSPESDSAPRRGEGVLGHPSSSTRRRGSRFHGELAGPPPSRGRRQQMLWGAFCSLSGCNR